MRRPGRIRIVLGLLAAGAIFVLVAAVAFSALLSVTMF
jgi:hypothetical protein